jgi:chromosome segregation ATPase
MKIKIAIIVLAIACLGLGIALFATKKQGDEQHEKDVSAIEEFSNQVVNANSKISDLAQVNITLTNDLALSRQESADLSNNLFAANATLADTKSTLATAQDQITNLNTQISDLEAQNKVLDERANELTNTIAQLNTLIDSTENKLAVAETNSAFLQDALQKQMAQRAEIEHKFNDLNEVRAQVKKLKDELFIARRAQLMKNDVSSKKGAELLMAHAPATNSAASNLPSNYDLNVEVGSDGSVKVIPPLGATNPPAQ